MYKVTYELSSKLASLQWNILPLGKILADGREIRTRLIPDLISLRDSLSSLSKDTKVIQISLL